MFIVRRSIAFMAILKGPTKISPKAPSWKLLRQQNVESFRICISDLNFLQCIIPSNLIAWELFADFACNISSCEQSKLLWFSDQTLDSLETAKFYCCRASEIFYPKIQICLTGFDRMQKYHHWVNCLDKYLFNDCTCTLMNGEEEGKFFEWVEVHTR